jgi:hypothetical protein
MAIQCKPYRDIPTDWDTRSRDGGPSLKDCCSTGTTEEPTGCDCCYDEWNNELKSKRGLFGQKTEEALQAKEKLLFSKTRRDGFKKWYDELALVDEYAREICDQFSLIISQVDQVCSSSKRTIDAVEILFCMIRDFYSQLDKIKYIYESLQKCIKEFDSSILAPGQGIMKCLEAYFDKLTTLLKTKEDLIRQMMDVVRLANMVQEDVCPSYGLSCILVKWQSLLGCNAGEAATEEAEAESELEKIPCDENYSSCEIAHEITFPIKDDPYFKWLKCNYEYLVTKVEENAKAYLKASQEKEAIATAINSLTEAVALTNPKERCQ